MTRDATTQDLEAALRWRGEDLQVTVCALFAATLSQADAQQAFAAAVADAFPGGYSLRVEQTSPQHPWFASVDAQVKDIAALQPILSGVLSRAIAKGAAAAWASFEGAVVEESDIFSTAVFSQHYAVACGPTLGLALDDGERTSARWKSTVAECRLRLARELPSLVTPT